MEAEKEATNAQKIGDFVLRSLDEFEDGEVEDIAVVCSLKIDEETTTVRFVCNNDRDHVRLGLLRAATLAAEEDNG